MKRIIRYGIILALMFACTAASGQEVIERLRTSDGVVQVFVVRSAGSTEVIVIAGDTVQTVTFGPQPDPPPLPPPVDLSAYVKRLTDKVPAKAAEFPEVSDIFFAIGARITSGELRGSKAIIDATTPALFGTEPDFQRQNWKAWYSTLMGHLLDDLKLVSPEQWADAYKTIGEAVKR